MKKITQILFFCALICMSTFYVAKAAPCDFPTTINSPISVTSLSATITWPSVGSGVVYSVWYRPVGGSWLTPTTTSTSLVLNSLLPGTLYEVKIRNACTSGGTFSAWSSTYNFTTNNDPCAYPPTEEYPIYVNSTSAKIEWSPLGVGAQYSVWYRTGGGAWLTPLTSDTFLNLSPLTPGTTYEVKMRTRCSSTEPWSAYGTTFTFLTLNEACAFPATIEAPITAGYTNALVEWNNLGTGTFYRPWYRKLPGGAWFTPTTYDTFMVYGGLDFDSDYEMKIKNECPSGSKSLFGPTTAFRTTLIGTGCGVDTLADTNGDSLILSFTGPIASIQDTVDGNAHGAILACATQNVSVGSPVGLYGYIYGRRSVTITAQNDGPANLTLYFTQADFDNYNANNTSFLDLPTNSTDTASKNQYIRIAKVVGTSTVTYGLGYKLAWDATLKLWKIQIPFTSLNGTYYFYTQPDCISVTVMNVNVPSGTIYGSSAIVNWDALSTPVPGSFELQYRKTSPLGSWVNAGTASGTVTTKLVSGLTPNTSYEVQVRKNCSQYSNSNWSTSAYFSTSSLACYVPAVFNTITPTATTAPLSWSNVSAYRYFIWYKKSADATWLTPSTSATSLTLTGLTPGTAYDVKIRNNCVLNGELSAFSAVTNFTTPALKSSNGFTDEMVSQTTNIFPNPTNGLLNIEMENKAGKQIQFKLIDVTGRLVMHSQSVTQDGLNNFSLNLESVTNGIYILQVIENGKLLQVSQVRKTN